MMSAFAPKITVGAHRQDAHNRNASRCFQSVYVVTEPHETEGLLPMQQIHPLLGSAST
jgi:hypothetical protein